MELTTAEYVAYYNCHMKHIVVNTLVYKKNLSKTAIKKNKFHSFRAWLCLVE